MESHINRFSFVEWFWYNGKKKSHHLSMVYKLFNMLLNFVSIVLRIFTIQIYPTDFLTQVKKQVSRGMKSFFKKWCHSNWTSTGEKNEPWTKSDTLYKNKLVTDLNVKHESVKLLGKCYQRAKDTRHLSVLFLITAYESIIFKIKSIIF